MIKFKILLTIVVLVIVGWAGAWFYGASKLRNEVDAQIVASQGAFSCSQDSIGGFPFRMFYDCSDLIVSNGDIRFSLARAKFSVVVTQPTLLVGFLQGPLEVNNAFSGAQYFVHWDEAKLSLRHDLRALDDGRVEMVNVRWHEAGGDAPTVSASRVSAYLQTREKTKEELASSAAGTENFAFFLAADALTIPSADIAGASAQVDIFATQLPPIDGRAVPRNFAQIWQKNGGTVILNDLAIRIGDAQLDGTGNFSLDTNGQLNGASEITLVNFNDYLASTPLGPLAGSFLGAPASGGDTQKMKIAIRKGLVMLGPLPLAQLDPLF